MEFRELLYKRRSTRAFTDKKVTKEQIEQMLIAATRAPNACNAQSWHFYAVTDDAIRARFAEDAVIAPWAAAAPVIFVVCTDGSALLSRFGEKARKYIIQDTALAMENIVLPAAEMGLGGCIMGMYDNDKCRAILQLPAEHEIVAVLPVGEPVSEPPLRERKPLSEVATLIGEPGAVLEGEKSEHYVLRGAVLKEARFEDLNLTGAQFENIKLENGTFKNINMKNVRFEDINFDGAVIADCCKIDGMTVDGVNLAEAIAFYKKNH